MILLKNCKIIDCSKRVDILIKDEIILDIKENIEETKDYQIFDCQNKVILPGLIDAHTHMREPGYTNKEDFISGTRSASKGGFTTILAMPNISPTPDNASNFEYINNLIKEKAMIEVIQVGAITAGLNGTKLSIFDEISKYTHIISDDGFDCDLELLDKAMQKAKELNLIITSHAEKKGAKETESEYLKVIEEIELVKKNKIKYHFCHISTQNSIKAINEANKAGLNITCEITPHHLILNKTLVNNNPLMKMKPPLASLSDCSSLIDYLINSDFVIIASDHAPHEHESKIKPFNECSNGIIGLETTLPILITHFIKKNKFNYTHLVELLVNRPSEIFRLNKNEIKVGSIANLIVIDDQKYRKYQKSEILSKSHNSPFIDYELTGFNELTIYKGQVVYLGGSYV